MMVSFWCDVVSCWVDGLALVAMLAWPRGRLQPLCAPPPRADDVAGDFTSGPVQRWDVLGETDNLSAPVCGTHGWLG